MKKAYSYIRFSSPEQAQGDSLRRQLERSQEYADRHGLDLNTSMRDLGLSAFSGEHRKKGDLASFLALVEAGKITQGSVLLVENLDRLSRENIDSAFQQFRLILKAGIEIVTLMDERHYTKASLQNTIEIMATLMVMERANEESRAKADRGKRVWDKKRKLAEQGIPVSRKCPNWLDVNADGTGFIIHEEKVLDILRIFNMSISGMGQRKIAATLNAEGVKPHGKTGKTFKPWNAVYIRSLLHNRALLGEYQPRHKNRNVGLPIDGYYPRIVDESLFYKAHKLMQQRTSKPIGGRKGDTFSNLFTGMCKCATCKSSFRMIQHKKAQTCYLTCSSNNIKSGCECDKRWRYRFIERAALLVLADKIDWVSIYGGEDDNKERLETLLIVAQAELDRAIQTRDRFASLFSTATDALLADATAKYQKAAEEVSELEDRIETINAELRAYQPANKKAEGIYKAFSEHFDSPTYERRSALNALLRDASVVLWFDSQGVYLQVEKKIEILIDAQNEEFVFDDINDLVAVVKAGAVFEEMEEYIDGLSIIEKE